MVRLKTLVVEELSRLKGLYKVNWPLYIGTYSIIDIFARRFVDHPEWTDRVTFHGVVDEPEHFGTVIMVHSGNRIYFDTLEPFPYDKLRRALIDIELGQKLTFISIRDSLRPLLLDIIRIRSFLICHEHGSRAYVFPKNVLDKLGIELPDGLRFGPLKAEHAKMVNDTWIGKFEDSEAVLEDAIRLNTSLGIYNQEGELIAWNMRLDDGCMSVGRIDPRYQGHHYGYLATLALAQKIAQEFDVDAFFHVGNGNERPRKDLQESSAELIDTFSWISVKRSENNKTNPWWGHL